MGSNPLIMKYLCLLFVIYLLAGCGNKKAEIVEEIKKTKNELAEAEMNRGTYSSAANSLQSYNTLLDDSKKYNSKQMASQAQIYKEGYETAIGHLKGVPGYILKDHKKLDSAAVFWEWKSKDAKSKIDSLEMELKKY
jgi:hypothetical protein